MSGAEGKVTDPAGEATSGETEKQELTNSDVEQSVSEDVSKIVKENSGPLDTKDPEGVKNEEQSSESQKSDDSTYIAVGDEKLSSQNDNDALFTKPKDVDRGHCYCGKDRNLYIIELLCANCNRWHHESCISYQLGKSVPFMMNYIFFCKNCSPTGVEIFKKNQATIQQLCISAIANLMQGSVREGTKKEFFLKDAEIVPYIDSHWEGLTTNPRRVTQSWHATVSRSLTKETSLFKVDVTGAMFGLNNLDIMHIRPNYEAMIKSGQLKLTELGVQLGNTNMKGRSGGKRKTVDGPNAALNKRVRVESAPVKLSAHGYPLEHPYNKDSFRYFLAEPDPNAPFRQEFDEAIESAGRPIPGWLYRPLCPNTVLIALHDRAPQLKVTEDRLTITGEKGYCLARATHYVTRGTWYYEVTITEMRDGSCSRIGWGQPYANLQTPLGFDKFGYSWRARKGTVFHEARGKHFSSGYGEGDTLGLMIHLPENENIPLLRPSLKDRPLVKFKSHLYYEEKDNIPEITKNLKSLEGSKIVFFKNGECEGTAFIDIYGGLYYPSVSLYKSCVLTLNFGPDFKYPPSKEEYSYKPMSDRADQMICEQTLSDIIFLTENEGELRLDL